MASKIQRELAFLLTGKDISASKSMKGVERSVDGLTRHTGKAARNIGKNIEHGFVIGAAAAAGAIGYSVKLAGDFQAGMQTINTVALATPENLGKAADGIRKVFRETGQSMEDLQAAEYDLVSAGIKLGDSQDGLEQSVKLGRGAYGSTSEAVDVLTTAINSYNLKAKDGTVATKTWTKVSDELAQAVADGKVKLSEIASTYAQVAPLAAQAGIGTDEVAAALGFLTAKGNDAGETLTQMSRAILELQKPNKNLLTLQEKTGRNYAKLAKQKGLHVALQQIRDDAKAQGVAFVDLFGRVEGYKFALQTTGPNARGFADELDRIRHSTGMTQKQYDERNQGLNYQLGVFKANLDDAAITIGTALLPQITALAKEGTDWLGAHQADIGKFAQDLADGLRDAVTWAKQLDWDKITRSLQAGAGFAKDLITAFANAPSWVQEFLIGGFLANKFTGGVLGDVVGDLIKSTLKGALGITAAVVNVSGGTVNGPGGGPGGGGGASPLSALPVVLSAVAVGELGYQISESLKQPLVDAFTSAFPNVKPGGVDVFKQGLDQFQATVLPGFDALNHLSDVHLDQIPVELGRIADFISGHHDAPGLTGHGGPGRGNVVTGEPRPVGEHAGESLSRVVQGSITSLQHGAVTAVDGTTTAVNASKDAVVSAQSQAQHSITAGVAASGVMGANAATGGASRVTSQSIGNASRIVGAISANRPVVTTSVVVNVTGAAVMKSQKTQTTYGPGSGSAGNDSGRIGGKG